MQEPSSDAFALSSTDVSPMPPLSEESATDEAVVAQPDDGALNLAERLVAQVGAWASTLVERWGPQAGPFFASDGRLAVDPVLFLTTECEMTPTES